MAVDGPPLVRRASDAWDAMLAVAVGVTVFGVYLATLYPGLLDIGDATKFAFVGKVLGTPHAPGYPLWVLVSHLFSYLPIGTLAYRMNLLSSVFGALTVAVVYLIARRLQTDRAVACTTALALGFGQAFWSRALYAKTYTLHAVLVSIGILLLLRWSDRRRPRDFFLAVAVFALSLGNHLSVVALLPALVLFPLLTDARAVLRPKAMIAVAAAAAAGLSQYAFILIRTRSGAPTYLEARARNLAELWDVMTARRFSHEIGAYSVPDLVFVRVPHVAGLVVAEIGVSGVVLLLVGLAVLVATRPRHALLLGLGGLGVTWLTANMGSEEDQGFLLSAFVLFWVSIGVGLQWTIRALAGRGARWPRALAAGLMVALPCAQVAANYRANDHHRDTFESEYFDALFAGLPERVAFVQDEYRVNMMLLYKLLGERAAGTRDIRLVPRDRNQIDRYRRDGFEVVTFGVGREALEHSGFTFSPFIVPATGRPGEVLHRRQIFRVLATPACLEIGNTGWQDLSRVSDPKGRMSVRIDNFGPFEARLTVYIGAANVRTPILTGVQGSGTPSLEVEVFSREQVDARARLAARIRSDGASLPDAILGARIVARVEVRVNDNGEHSMWGLDLGTDTSAAVGAAFVDQDEPKRATLCSHPLAAADVLPLGRSQTSLAWDATDVQFGEGWHAVERRPDGFTWRWTTERAMLLLPLDHPRTLRVSISAEPINAPRPRPSALTLVVNGHRMAPRELARVRTSVAWTVPGEWLRSGFNELALEVDGAERPVDLGLSPDDRRLGVSVTAIHIEDMEMAAPVASAGPN